MAVAFRSASTGASLATALPTGNAQNDILFAQIYTENVEPETPTTATGWNYLDGYTAAPTTDISSCHWYWIARGASAPATNWAAPGTGWSEVSYLCYSGADTTTPIDTYAKNVDATLNATTVWSTITTTAAQCMIVGMAAVGHFTTCTSAQWTNERADGGASMAVHLFDQGTQAAGSQGSKTETSGIGWFTIQIGLKPAAGGGAAFVAPGPQIIGQAAPIQRACQW